MFRPLTFFVVLAAAGCGRSHGTGAPPKEVPLKLVPPTLAGREPHRPDAHRKRLAEENKTKGGIIIPDTAKEKPLEGKVVAVGNGKVLEDGKVRALDIKPGDRVLFGKYSGTEVKLDGEEALILREDDKLHRWNSTRRISMPPTSIHRIAAGINKSFRECLRHVLEITEVRVIPFPLSGQQCMKGMMKIVIPLSVQAISAQL